MNEEAKVYSNMHDGYAILDSVIERLSEMCKYDAEMCGYALSLQTAKGAISQSIEKLIDIRVDRALKAIASEDENTELEY